MKSLLTSRRLIVVTGKGGVGKTTVSAALAAAASQLGRRTCLVELYGQDRIPTLLGLGKRSYLPQATPLGFDTMSLTVNECVEDFGSRKLRMGGLVRMTMKSQIVSAFLDAVPGLHDLQQLGKIENLLLEPLDSDPRYDLMIVDAPATGHGLTFLASARTMRSMARVGPFHDLAAIVENLLSDPKRCGVTLVTLPEELPANETLELVENLEEDQELIGALVVNQVRPDILPPNWEPTEVDQWLETSDDEGIRALRSMTQSLVARIGAQHEVIESLLRQLPEMTHKSLETAVLPRWPTKPSVEEIRQMAQQFLEAP